MRSSLLDLAVLLAADAASWRGRARCDRLERDAVQLVRGDDFDAWVIGWPPGHDTTPHDHGRSRAAFVVVGGELVERTGGRPPRRLGRGDVSTVPAGAVHDVGTAPDRTATSIHVYSPPLATMTFYDPAGRPDPARAWRA